MVLEQLTEIFGQIVQFLVEFAELLPVFLFEPRFWDSVIIYGLLLFGYAMIAIIVFLMMLSVFNKLRYRYSGYKFDDNYRPTFSVIVPAYNEGKVIGRTIRAFLKTSYPTDKKEIIIVNDGSTDETRRIAEKYASKIINSETQDFFYRKGGFEDVILVNRKIGGKGKSHVLNDGRKFSTGKILLIIDADVQLSREIFEKAARHFVDERVGSVAGYISVSEKKGQILNEFVNFECSLAQKVMRLGFDTLGIHYIVPGGCGFFRRNVLNTVGDYEGDTLAEDTDMTFRIMTETKKKIHFDPSISVEADEPTTLSSLWNQRIRWARGNFGVTRKHFRKVGKAIYGKAVTYGYPFWIASIIIPLTFLITTLGLLTNSVLKIDITPIAVLGRILAYVFIGIWGIGVIINKGRSWFAGLISPGIPMLITMFASLIWPHGIEDMVAFFGYSSYTSDVSFVVLSWIVLALVLSYSVMLLSKKHPKIANFIQLGLFGYWIVLVICGLVGYAKELKGDKQIWIRTVR